MDLINWPFYLISLLILAGALGVLFFKNVMHAAFSLMISLISVAVLYIYAGAEFVGATQLLVYVGGIVVLLIFGIMLSRINKTSDQFSGKGYAFIVAVLFSYLLIRLISTLNFTTTESTQSSSGNQIKDLGISFFTNNLLAFEAAGVLLLVALIGAMTLFEKQK